MKKYVLALVLILLLAGCTNQSATPEPIMGMTAWESTKISGQQEDFYKSVTVAVEKVDTEKKTAATTVTMPDLEKYLLDGDAYDGSTFEVEIEFPVDQVEGEWQITSVDPLIDYIRNESDRILIELIESMGGIKIDYDPQEVPEQ